VLTNRLNKLTGMCGMAENGDYPKTILIIIAFQGYSYEKQDKQWYIYEIHHIARIVPEHSIRAYYRKILYKLFFKSRN
jgi:hypothetical protein